MAISTSAARVRTAAAFDAAIFDMDGVITDTAAVHSSAWKRMFDEFLRERALQSGEPFREFTHTQDYLRHVDGKPRLQGITAFLASRGILLPLGTPDDPPTAATIHGLGHRKNAVFHSLVATGGVRVYESSVALIRALWRAGITVGLATSSKNSALILGQAGVRDLFATVVDGLVAEQLRLQGKPHPDIFISACARLGTSAARAIVVEDAVSGVRAGASGGFGLVIGVAREDNAAELRASGADIVVRDLAEITVEEIDRQVRHKAAAA